MASLLEELKRRNVIRVAVGYLVLAWIVLQITDLVAPALRLPEWTLSFVTFIGIIGFPFALFFAWAFELTPDGIKRSEDVMPEDSITKKTGGNLNKLIIGMLCVAIIILLGDRFFGLSRKLTSGAAPVTAESTAPGEVEADAAGLEDDLPRSIAVLPFVNMSGDAEQEYFSDGISEELLNALAQIRELRVAARTSSFAFKGMNQDISEIGERLNVETVLEGSVRRSGKRVRITAQLINVGDGFHLWSNTYDRDLTDIFAVQDEISGAIVDALKVHLTDEKQLAATEQVDIEAYNWALQARHAVRLRTRESLELALRQYQKALDIAPDYADAWAGKALAVLLLRDDQYGSIPQKEAARQGQDYLDRAFALNPRLSVAHGVQALLYGTLGKYEESLESIDRAIELNPSEGVWYMWKSQSLLSLGRVTEARMTLRKAYQTDPLHAAIRHNYMRQLVDEKQFEAARGLTVPGTSQNYFIEVSIALAQREPARAWQVLEEWERAMPEPSRQREELREFTRAAGLADMTIPLREGIHPIIRAMIEPEEIIELYRPEEPLQIVGEPRHAYTVALSWLGRCNDILDFTQPYKLFELESYGPAVDDHSTFALGLLEAQCLAVTGQGDRASALAGRLLEAMESQGTPVQDDYLTEVRVLLHFLGGDSRAAAELSQQGTLRWMFFRANPAASLFEKDPELRELKGKAQATVNGERAKLGWEPVEI